MSKNCCDTRQEQTAGAAHFNIGLLGNPNCGKSTLFNQLTGSRQRIGNWPGVTVDRKMGQFEFHNTRFDIVDLPGVYSLDTAPARWMRRSPATISSPPSRMSSSISLMPPTWSETST
ncbi:MAG: 50S ribosome-binding GTPase [Gammaproteobacteria bacterium]|nr:50S ribosome-binding GTPase [Gammaproteobacteria bacterium]